MNFLEQLAAEWFGYLGYFVRTNIKMNKRAKGGWDNEIDVLAHSHTKGELIHIESSWDANTWEDRRKRFIGKKFVYTQAQYEQLVGCKLGSVRRIALCGLGQSAKADLDWGSGIEVRLIPHFVAEIASALSQKNPLLDIVPEGYPRLRAMQFALAYGKAH